MSDVLKPGKDVVWLQVPFSAGRAERYRHQTAKWHELWLPGEYHAYRGEQSPGRENPAAAKLFSVMKLPLADINAQNAMMHAGKSSEADIKGHVDGWIKAHQQQFDGWVKEALEAQK